MLLADLDAVNWAALWMAAVGPQAKPLGVSLKVYDLQEWSRQKRR